MEVKDWITFVGILLTFISATVAAILTWRTAKRSRYVNNIVSEKEKRSDNFRDACMKYLTYLSQILNCDEDKDQASFGEWIKGLESTRIEILLWMDSDKDSVIESTLNQNSLLIRNLDSEYQWYWQTTSSCYNDEGFFQCDEIMSKEFDDSDNRISALREKIILLQRQLEKEIRLFLSEELKDRVKEVNR